MTTETTATEIYGVSDKWHQYVAVSLRPMRVIYKCKKCKHTWAREYRKVYRSMGGFVEHRQYSWLSRHEDPVFSVQRFENGKVIEQDHDYQCPQCDYRYITANIVRGVRTEKKCDARCQNAKGPDCECACGGEHHGMNHLI